MPKEMCGLCLKKGGRDRNIHAKKHERRKMHAKEHEKNNPMLKSTKKKKREKER